METKQLFKNLTKTEKIDLIRELLLEVKKDVTVDVNILFELTELNLDYFETENNKEFTKIALENSAFQYSLETKFYDHLMYSNSNIGDKDDSKK